MEVSLVEINESNYCDQKPVAIQFSYDEHLLLNHVLDYVLDAYEFVQYEDLHDLPENSTTLQKYQNILSLKEIIHQQWIKRFDNPPYDNT